MLPASPSTVRVKCQVCLTKPMTSCWLELIPAFRAPRISQYKFHTFSRERDARSALTSDDLSLSMRLMTRVKIFSQDQDMEERYLEPHCHHTSLEINQGKPQNQISHLFAGQKQMTVLYNFTIIKVYWYYTFRDFQLFT